MVLEFLEHTLTEVWLKLDLIGSIRVIFDVLRGIEAAHAANLALRDAKRLNILCRAVFLTFQD